MFPGNVSKAAQALCVLARERLVVRWLRGGQIAVVTALLSVLPATAAENRSQLDAFHQFLSGTNWVADIHFSQSGNLFSYAAGDRKAERLKGFVHYRGALQPDTWFLLNLSNTPAANHRRAGTNLVVGASISNYWSLSADRLMLNATPRLGAAQTGEVGGMSIVASNALSRLEWALSLGLLQLKRGSLQWLDESNFVAEGNAKTAHGKKLRGTIHADTQFRVSGLTYTLESSSVSETFDVVYTYQLGVEFPPFETRVTPRKRDSKARPYTNRIHAMTAGLLPLLEGGFKPSDFQDAGSPPLQYLSVRRADSNILHLADGRTLSYSANEAFSDNDLASVMRPRAGGWPVKVAFFAGMAVLIGIITRRFRRGKTQQTQ